MLQSFTAPQSAIDKALAALGIRNFLLGLHDAAFPGQAGEDIGRGSPYSDGAAGFLEFARSLGFNGVQLGPQGITTPANPSPYDSSFFSRNPLSLAVLPLTRNHCRLLAPEYLKGFTATPAAESRWVDETSARQAMHRITAEICRNFRSLIRNSETGPGTELHRAYEDFRRQNGEWLKRDALYEILRKVYGARTWRQWPDTEEGRLDRRLFAPPAGREMRARARLEQLYRLHAAAIDDYGLIQFLLAEQHREFRERCRGLGLRLFGDCQIGLSGRDAWYAQSFLLPDYRLGAPPSRTNPEGQPWNYPVFDPHRYFNEDSGGRQPGPVVFFLRTRAEKLFEEFDGLRLDHPHGLVCPWVYRANQADPVKAVQNGARLFASPGLADHPELAQYAIVRPDQLDHRLARHDDNWVTDLEPDQVRRYGLLFEVFMATAREKCRGACEIASEILSTQPYPIKRVMELHGLGRFRVTQKADLENKRDVYRSENARPEDWLMLGNHDTPPIWQVADRWHAAGTSSRQAAYLAERLRIPAAERPQWFERLARDPGALVQAKFADLFVGPAENIMVFFTDLLGGKDPYNRPGTVSSSNWSQRIPPDYKRQYAEKTAADQALNIPKGLALAMRARGSTFSNRHRNLIEQLENFQPV